MCIENALNQIHNPTISVVVPVYGCAQCLGQLCIRIERSIHLLTNKYEIILIDDRSRDNGWEIIKDLQKNHRQIKGIRLSRNFGQHIAISAGLSEARGDYIIVMDCDLQDPPEIIPKLFAKLHDGYDLVLAYRSERTHSYFRICAAKIYFKLMSWFTGENIDGNYGTFSILSKKVVNAYLKFNEKDRHYLFILRWLGFKAGRVDYAHQSRYNGKSTYSLRLLLQHAIGGLIFQTTIFLKWITISGIVFSISGILWAFYFIFQYFRHSVVPGWTSITVLILICTGIILFSLGVIGLYIGKIFDQTKNRPLFIIDEIIHTHHT